MGIFKYKRGTSKPMTPRKEKVYFMVYSYIKEGYSLSQIREKLQLSKQALNKSLTTLKRNNFIKKVGYGCYSIGDKTPLRSKPLTPRDTLNTSHFRFTSDTVRAHAFIIKFEIPRDFRNWDKRREILQSLNIPFKDLGTYGGAQQIEVKGSKVWLTHKSIVLNLKNSFFSDTATDGKSQAISEAMELIRSVESLIKANLGRYRFKVCRNHYALIKNALAKQYDKEGKKLYIADDGGYWFLIDNSFNLHEAETVHPKTAESDNKIIQDFFNDLKLNPITPSLLMRASYQNAENLNSYAVHLKAHVESVIDLGKGVRSMNKKIEEFSKAIDLLTKTINRK